MGSFTQTVEKVSMGVICTSLLLESEVLQRHRGRIADDPPKLVGEPKAADECDAHAGQGMEDSAAQFLQVLQKRHAQHALLFVVAAAPSPGGRRWGKQAAAVAGRHGPRRAFRFGRVDGL